MKEIKRFLKFLKPYWKKGLLAFFLMLISVLLQLPMPFLTRYIIDKVILLKSFKILNIIGFVLIGVIFLQSFSSFLENYLLTTFRARVLFDVRYKLYEHVQLLPLKFFHDKGTGYLMARISGDVDTLQGLLADTFIASVRNLLIFITGIACTLYLHKKLALICFSILPLYALILYLFNKKIRNLSGELREKYANMQKELQELLSGITIIKAFCGEKTGLIKFIKRLKELARQDVKLGITSTLFMITSGIISSIAPLVLIWYGCAEIMRGNLTIGSLIAFNSFIRYLFGPTQALMNINLNIQRSLASCQRIFELFDEKPEIKEDKKAIEIKEIKGKVKFKNVCFSYDSEITLKNVSFEVNPGEKVALVGHSGAGKSTIVKLLMRFYEPQKGEILIDDVDIRRIKIKSLRDKIAIVTQDVFLFSGSIKENIRFGKPSATDEEIVESAKKSHAHDFIIKLPKGYDTEIGERGVKLSGGERQRIAIARAILKNPKILILDEATSQIDTESEKLIREALLELMKDKTTFIIAHRLSSVINADKIIVIEGGEIIDIGKHEELLKRCNVYKNLYLNYF